MCERDEEGSFGWNLAIEKAWYVERVSKQVLKQSVPELEGLPRYLLGLRLLIPESFISWDNSKRRAFRRDVGIDSRG